MGRLCWIIHVYSMSSQEFLWVEEGYRTELEILRCCSIFSEDGGKDQEPRSRGSFQELGKMRKEDAPLEATEGTQLCWYPGTHWKSPWCWERLRAGEEGTRGWDGCMASPMQWTWSWANFGRWWGTGRPGVLQSMGLQRVGHDLVTEQQQPYVRLWSPEL